MRDKIEKLAALLKSIDSSSYDELIMLAMNGATGPLLLSDKKVSDGLFYHIDNNIPLSQPIYRAFSDKYIELIKEARELVSSGELIVDSASEKMLSGDLLNFGYYEDMLVPLDFPMNLADEYEVIKSAAEYKGKKVKLNKPRYIRKDEPGYGRKQYVVFVKDPKTKKIKRVVFGDPDLRAKPYDPKARKSFRARHKCDEKEDKTKPGTWACRWPPRW